jgi:hypothetical protein
MLRTWQKACVLLSLFTQTFPATRDFLKSYLASDYSNVSYHAHLFPKRLTPCGEYAAFLSTVHGIPVQPNDDCIEADVHIAVPATVGILVTTDAAGKNVHALSNPSASDFTRVETAIVPLQLIADKKDDDTLPPYRFLLKPSFHRNEYYVLLTAVCSGNYPFVQGLAATIEAARMSNQQKIDLARSTPAINTGYEQLIFGWRRFFLATEAWNSMLTDDARLRLLEQKAASNNLNQRS